MEFLQEKLFKVAGLPMVENCMSGYNSCMFAYGQVGPSVTSSHVCWIAEAMMNSFNAVLQTGSGKTYTMMGEISEIDGGLGGDCGMTPRIFEYLFTRISAVSN